MNKSIQYFSPDYLQSCKKMTPDQVLEFLENFRLLLHNPGKLQQINLRVPENTLSAFKAKASSLGIPYQQKIKELMTAWAFGE